MRRDATGRDILEPGFDLLPDVERVEDVFPGGFIGQLFDEFAGNVLGSGGYAGYLLCVVMGGMSGITRTASSDALRT